MVFTFFSWLVIYIVMVCGGHRMNYHELSDSKYFSSNVLAYILLQLSACFVHMNAGNDNHMVIFVIDK